MLNNRIPVTYWQQVFGQRQRLNLIPLGLGLLLLALGLAAPYAHLGLGDGRLLLGVGALVLAVFFLVPLFSAEQRAQRRAGPR